ncbi:MAG: hypothetical protein GY780_02945 [bacterium]|nr:hypothetical protein [bacterium]
MFLPNSPTRLIVVFSLILILLGVDSVSAQDTPVSGLFFETPPATGTSETLAPDLLSARFKPHSCLSFSPDGTEAAWSSFYDIDPEVEYDQRIFLSSFDGETWSEPELAPFAGEYLCGGPIFSPDGKSLIFTGKFPIEGDGQDVPNRIWVVSRENEGWGEARLLDENFGAIWISSQISIATNSNMYFVSRADGQRTNIWQSIHKSEGYDKPTLVAGPVNTPGFEVDAWIDPQERYLLFTGFHRIGGHGGADLYISFPSDDGQWGTAMNLGSIVNTPGFERFPSVSPDGRSLFWVHADGNQFPGANHHFQRVSMASVLNTLGYDLIEECKAEQARVVLQLATELFPEDWNAWDSLADACKNNLDREGAEKAYNKALELNPDASSAYWGLRMLDRFLLDRAAETTEAKKFKPGQETRLRGPYLGQKLPGLTPEIFAPGIFSVCGRVEYNPAFSPDGKEVYFSTNMGLLKCRNLEKGWTAPEPAGIAGFEPHITADGQYMFIGRGPEIWRLINQDGQWVDDRKICDGMRPWTDPEGNLYVTDITTRGGGESFLVMLPRQGDGFGEPEELPEILNEPMGAAHPCVSPDGALLIFDSRRTIKEDDLPYGDFYMSRRTPEGQWGVPLRLPVPLNSPGENICASFSPDGKYLFFTANRDIYWVSAEILETLSK